MCDYNRKFPIYLTNNIINYLLYYFYVSLLLSFVLFLLDSRFRMWPPTQLIVLWSLHIIVLNNSVFIITHYYAVVQISIIFTFINKNWCVSVRIIFYDGWLCCFWSNQYYCPYAEVEISTLFSDVFVYPVACEHWIFNVPN